MFGKTSFAVVQIRFIWAAGKNEAVFEVSGRAVVYRAIATGRESVLSPAVKLLSHTIAKWHQKVGSL